jgi:hypothetical protein
VGLLGDANVNVFVDPDADPDTDLNEFPYAEGNKYTEDNHHTNKEVLDNIAHSGSESLHSDTSYLK